MTNPNWWDVEPYKTECKSTAHDLYTFCPHCDGTRYFYDIPAILEKAKAIGVEELLTSIRKTHELSEAQWTGPDGAIEITPPLNRGNE